MYTPSFLQIEYTSKKHTTISQDKKKLQFQEDDPSQKLCRQMQTNTFITLYGIYQKSPFHSLININSRFKGTMTMSDSFCVNHNRNYM